MSEYSFSQLIREILPNIPGLRARVYKHTPSELNAVDSENFRTRGEVISDYFFVAPQNRSLNYRFIVAPRNNNQNQLLQLRKESIQTCAY